MNHTYLRKLLCLAGLLALAAPGRAADRIELTDGSIIMGKLLSADGGKFKVDTAFAGKIEIAQDKIRSFTTDEPVNVAVAPGNTVQGRVAASGTGLQVVAAGATLNTTTANVAAVWRVGEDSPEVAKLRRKWKYEAAVAINGRSGAAQKFAGALGFKATLASSQDKLVFDLAAEKATDNGVETANRQAAGVDYSSLFSEKGLW
ncbi:MAG: hypothetical protein JWQ62_840, partial [Lacunisphaera sp.]|nr:hypothetical protein [Lacunisphaera sp.]